MANFELAFDLQRAYIDKNSGKKCVVGICSDNLPDHHNERVSDQLLQSWVRQCQQGLELLDTHRSTFPFGKSVDGHLTAGPQGETQLNVVLELDDRYPQSQVLYGEVEAGICRKQMSIGGMLNLDNPDCVSWETTKDGELIRVLNDVPLDHIATTRENRAANARTGFTGAIVKALEDAGYEFPDPPADEEGLLKQVLADLQEEFGDVFAEAGEASESASGDMAATATVEKPYSGPGDSKLPDHVKKLGERQRSAWVKAWNNAFDSCRRNGGKQSSCEGTAFRIANGVLSRFKETDEMGKKADDTATDTATATVERSDAEMVVAGAQLLKQVGSAITDAGLKNDSVILKDVIQKDDPEEEAAAEEVEDEASTSAEGGEGGEAAEATEGGDAGAGDGGEAAEGEGEATEAAAEESEPAAEESAEKDTEESEVTEKSVGEFDEPSFLTALGTVANAAKGEIPEHLHGSVLSTVAALNKRVHTNDVAEAFLQASELKALEGRIGDRIEKFASTVLLGAFKDVLKTVGARTGELEKACEALHKRMEVIEQVESGSASISKGLGDDAVVTKSDDPDSVFRGFFTGAAKMAQAKL